LEIWNAELNSIGKKNRGTSSIQLNILILQLTVFNTRSAKNIERRLITSSMTRQSHFILGTLSLMR
jgi:hypothetical protein